MPALKYTDVPAAPVTQIAYKDSMQEVTGITIRWLSRAMPDENGNPGYGLRHFTAAPGGYIPIHKHGYAQTVYILTGQFECHTYDPDTDQLTEACMAGPGDSVYSPSMVPHGMRNVSDSEEATFLCCICNGCPEDESV